jgi:hypothetical protein
MGKDHVPGAQPPNYHEFMEYNINHDEWIASKEALRKKDLEGSSSKAEVAAAAA